MTADERGRDDRDQGGTVSEHAGSIVPESEPERGERERDVRERDQRTHDETYEPAPGVGPYGPGHWAWRGDPRRLVPEHLRSGSHHAPAAGDPDREDTGTHALREEMADPRYEARTGASPQPRDYAGVGPSRYRRSDEKIYDDVNQRLTDHPAIDARDVEVFIEDGAATLKGQVPTSAMKRAAADVARLTTGVREVRNELRVGSEPRPGDVVATREVGHDADVVPGMHVVDVNGDRVGVVKSIQGESFHLDRPMRRDLYVPLRAVREVTGDQVLLQYRAEDMDDMGWDSPELLGARRPRP